MTPIQVTNCNPFPLPGRFDGISYVFPPGKAVELPRDAATHIFGLGQQDKTRAFAQLGILKAGVTMQEARAVYDNISFAEGHMTYEEVPLAELVAQANEPEKQPGQPPGHQPGQHPGQKDHPDKEKQGPGKDEDDESEESGGRPGAPSRSPGRKSEGEGSMHTLPSDDLKSSRRRW